MIHKRQIRDVTVLNVEGNLDYKEVVDLKNTINSLISGGCTKVVLGLKGVRRIDFLSLCILVESKRELMDRKGDLKLAAISEVLTEYMMNVGAEEQFTMFSSVKDAAKSYSR